MILYATIVGKVENYPQMSWTKANNVAILNLRIAPDIERSLRGVEKPKISISLWGSQALKFHGDVQQGDTVWASGFLRVEHKTNREGDEFMVLNMKASAFEIVSRESII